MYATLSCGVHIKINGGYLVKLSQYNLILLDEEKNQYILFNTLYGHVLKISEETAQNIENNELEKISQEDKELFGKYNIIIPKYIDETRYFTYNNNKSKFNHNVTSSTVLLTWACNLACIYCYEGAGTLTDTMSIDNAEKYIKFMINRSEMYNSRQMHVNLFGGEPLINIECGFYILDKLKHYCDNKKIEFSCSIITNGTLLEDEIINRLYKYNCQSIQITLDGMKKTHDTRRLYKSGKGSFDKIIQVLRKLSCREEYIHTVIRINVDKTNLDEAYELLHYLGKDGEKLTNFTVDFGIVRGSTVACSAYSGKCIADEQVGDVLEELWHEAEKQGFVMNTQPYQRWMYCGVYGDNQYTITPNVEVYKCWEHAGMKEHLMGRIDEAGSLVELQYAYFDWMTKNPLEDKDCRKCKYLPACGGGCGVVSYNETKTYHSKGCFKVKGVLEKQILRYIKQQENNN